MIDVSSSAAGAETVTQLPSLQLSYAVSAPDAPVGSDGRSACNFW